MSVYTGVEASSFELFAPHVIFRVPRVRYRHQDGTHKYIYCIKWAVYLGIQTFISPFPAQLVQTSRLKLKCRESAHSIILSYLPNGGPGLNPQLNVVKHIFFFFQIQCWVKWWDLPSFPCWNSYEKVLLQSANLEQYVCLF